uniref:Uncharacterized protein n=1 Tax=Glycine max TaxID=3847 RepID=C6TAX8_SOYBN|nr:unknown [Glycine max]
MFTKLESRHIIRFLYQKRDSALSLCIRVAPFLLVRSHTYETLNNIILGLLILRQSLFKSHSLPNAIMPPSINNKTNIADPR